MAIVGTGLVINMVESYSEQSTVARLFMCKGETARKLGAVPSERVEEDINGRVCVSFVVPRQKHVAIWVYDEECFYELFVPE